MGKFGPRPKDLPPEWLARVGADAADRSARGADRARGDVVSQPPTRCPRCQGGQMLIEDVQIGNLPWQMGPGRVCTLCGFEAPV